MKSTHNAKKIQLLVIANVPGPNLNDFYEQIAMQDGLDVTVLFCSKTTKKWKEGVKASKNYRHKILWNLNPFSQYGRMQINPGVLRFLLFSKADIIQIQGYTTPTLFLSLLTAWLFKKPFVYWGEMIGRSGSTHPVSLGIKKFVVKILNSAKRVYIIGADAADSYVKLGLKKELIRNMHNSCDLSSFYAVSQSRNKERNIKTRNIVTTSQLIPRKRVDLLIKSFISLADDFPDWNLKIIGSGPLRGELEELVPAYLKSRVEWLGYVAKTQHPEVYKNCDIFVLASNEDGGPVVLPEALASGLPIIATDGAATATDLIQDGIHGYVVPKNHLKSLEQKLRHLVSDEKSRIRMGKNAPESAKLSDAYHNAKNYADDIKSLFEKAT